MTLMTIIIGTASSTPQTQLQNSTPTNTPLHSWTPRAADAMTRTAEVRIGTAGWSIPRAAAFRFECLRGDAISGRGARLLRPAPFAAVTRIAEVTASLLARKPRSFRHLLLGGAELAQESAKDCVIYGLNQMGVKARLLGPA